jgi:hypothetical protein
MRAMVISTAALFFGFLSGCRTLDPGAETVTVTDKVSDQCKNLGVVNIDWAYWGVSTEVLNVLRNQVAEKGGNTLVQTAGGDTGIAYSCPKQVSKLEN